MAENKKDSFTFSDKIKNSKPAFNPFSKRASSKIGANGKPKKTIFERTKRDAPFFVAAAAALLMLPFLYKYSGNIEDGGMLVPPGSEDTIFDPERFGFDPSVEDPTGQIAQYTGRDSFDLIKGWGSDEEPAADDSEVVDWRVQDGLDDNWNSTPSAPARSYAPAATRAAFQRTPTKINELGSASLNLRGGGGSIGRFGGANLKAAARQDSSGGPRQGIKPVSLQPLRAADSPSRSYFGQGGAAQARASRDAMGKSNALQALADAMFDPVRAGGVRGGGLGSGAFGTPGGGAQINHTLDYKGITPWWWDMMKERSQEAWRWKYFLWRKNLVEPLIKALAEVAAEFGKGLTCCLLTGEDDCSMGSMWGTRGDSYQPGGCKINKVVYTSIQEVKNAYPTAPIAGDLKKWCESMAGNENQQYGAIEWVSEKGGGGDLGFFGKRLYCMGGTFGGGRNSGKAKLEDRFQCEALDTTHNFSLQTQGEANKWHQYHAIIAKNYVPFDNNGTHYLCGGGNRNVNRKNAGALDSIPLAGWSEDVQRTASKNTQTHTYVAGEGENTVSKNMLTEGLVRDDVNDSCVIYVAEGGILDWDNFKTKTMTMLDALQLKDETGQVVSGERAFGALHLYFIEGYAFKHKMSKGANVTKAINAKGKTVKVRGMPVDELPLKYVDFEEYYVLHRGNSSKDTTNFKDNDRNFADGYVGADGKTRSALANGGKEDAIRGYCAFSTFRIQARAIDTLNAIEADLTFDPAVHGQNAGGIKVTLDIPEAGLTNLTPERVAISTGTASSVASYRFTPQGAQIEALAKVVKNGNITAKWRAEFQHKQSMDEEVYGAGEPPINQLEEPGKCEPGAEETNTDADGCELLRHCKQDGTWSDWLKTDPNCGRQNVTPTPVGFFEYVGSIPSVKVDLLSPSIRKEGSSNQATKLYGVCDSLKGISTVELKAVDNETKALLDKAQAMYNQTNKDNNSALFYTPDHVTVANLLDAMAIVQTDIPLNAVCMLGKTIGAASKDGSNGNNMFGAFAAYMGPDSSFFPALMKRVNGKDTIDYRFYGCASGKEVNNNKAYHYGHYNWNHARLGDQIPDQNDRQPFVSQLQGGPWKGAPLKAIADAVGFTRYTSWQADWGRIGPTDSMDSYNRRKYHEAYKDIFQSDGSCGLSGTMDYEDVKDYINALCQYGPDNLKPTNGDQLDCNRRFKADTNAYMK